MHDAQDADHTETSVRVNIIHIGVPGGRGVVLNDESSMHLSIANARTISMQLACVQGNH